MSGATLPAPETRRLARRPRLLGTIRHSSLSLKIGVSILVLYLLVALFAPLIAPYNPLQQDIPQRLLAPSWQHLLGTDGLGRDGFSRLVYATRFDLLLALGATSLSMVFGTAVGLLGGYFRGWVDVIVSRLIDLLMTIPGYPLLVLMLFVLGSGPVSIIIAFAVSGWVSYARLTRGPVMAVREREFIAAARLGAIGHPRVIVRHVLPNVVGQVLVLWASDIVMAISAIAALGYLGIGIQDPTPEWGVMILDGQQFLLTNWWLSAVPGFVIVILGLGLALISDSVVGKGRAR